MSGAWTSAIGRLQQACQSCFGVPILYTPSPANHPDWLGGAVVAVGVLDERREILTLMGTHGMDTLVPNITLDVILEDLVLVPMKDDEITIGGFFYQVRDVKLDGVGGAVLTLDRQ